MASGTGRYGDFVPQNAGLIQERGIFLLHSHRTAATPDIPGKGKQFLHSNHFHVLVTGSPGSLFQIQSAANRNAEHIDTRFLTSGNQCLEHLLPRHTDGICSMVSAEVLFVIFVKGLPAGNLCTFHQTDGIGFCSHKITVIYYTTPCQHLQVGIVCSFKGYPKNITDP